MEINFEEDIHIRSLFENSLNPDELVEKLSAVYNKPIRPGKTLLFFDEIQSCIPAIRSLRFFAEKMPQFHFMLREIWQWIDKKQT